MGYLVEVENDINHISIQWNIFTVFQMKLKNNRRINIMKEPELTAYLVHLTHKV